MRSAECGICGDSSSSLGSHIRSLHLGPALWACADCDYRHSPAFAVAHSLLEGHGLKQPDQRAKASNTTRFIASHGIPPLRNNRNLVDCYRSEKAKFQSPVSQQGQANSKMGVEGPNGEKKDGDNKRQIEESSSAPQSWESFSIDQTIFASDRIESDKFLTEVEAAMPITCRKCKVALPRWFQSDLARHVRSCSNIRPFSCSSCRHTSAAKSTLQQHIRRGKGDCAEASLLTMDEERCRAAVAEAIRLSFPFLDQ